MIHELSTLLLVFSPCFSRVAAFRWFVVIIFGMIIRLDFHGVTSFIRWLALDPEHYEALLSFYRASSWRLSEIIWRWLNLILEKGSPIRINGFLMMVGDGIKLSKEAERMPGVKSLHQESDNSGKASYIFGHHFGVLGLLSGTLKHMFCVPFMAEIHEGVEHLRLLQDKKAPEVEGKSSVSIVTLMLTMAANTVRQIGQPCMLIIDAYFAVGPTFIIARECLDTTGNRLLHIITRAKSNAVGYEGVPQTTDQEKRGRGRPAIWGNKIVLQEQFAQRASEFQSITINIYGKETSLSYLCLDLLWKPIRERVRFILVKDGADCFILICSNLDWLPKDIIFAYSCRFKIEVTFKNLKNLLGTFCYHFWTLAMPKLSKKVPVDLTSVSAQDDQRRIAKTANAIESFVNFGCIALGILQILAINYPQGIWNKYTGWLRTRRTEIPTEETVCSVIRENFYHNFDNFSHTAIYRLIKPKRRRYQHLYGEDVA